MQGITSFLLYNVGRREVEYLADEIKVSPNPIQRNVLDVATELTQLYYESRTPESLGEIQDTFTQLYAVASVLDKMNSKYLGDLLPDKLKGIFKEHY
jgi:hypothetical protein